MSAVFRLIRSLNVILTFTVAVVAISLSKSSPAAAIYILAGLAAAATAAAGNIINDIYDIEIDKINRPLRPLPAKDLSVKTAIVLYVSFVVLSLILSWFVNLYAFLIVASANLLLFFYSKHLKKTVLAGNFVVSFLTGLVFIYGGIVAENLSVAIIPAIFAFLINLIREIIKDMQDFEGDKSAGVITFPIKFGFQRPKLVILFAAFILMLFTIYPFIIGLYYIEYFVIIMIIVNPLIIYSLKLLFKDHSPENLKKISNILKLDMVIGLIAIYFGI